MKGKRHTLISLLEVEKHLIIKTGCCSGQQEYTLVILYLQFIDAICCKLNKQIGKCDLLRL